VLNSEVTAIEVNSGANYDLNHDANHDVNKWHAELSHFAASAV
jgi:hypothetical protein